MESKSGKIRQVVYINAAVMGGGDDALGALLMGNFLNTLGEFGRDISHVLLVNAGVRLACEGSDKLEVMSMLAESGMEILACGTCLDHFKVQDSIRAGRRSNMFTIVDILTRAEKIITP